MWLFFDPLEATKLGKLLIFAKMCWKTVQTVHILRFQAKLKWSQTFLLKLWLFLAILGHRLAIFSPQKRLLAKLFLATFISNLLAIQSENRSVFKTNRRFANFISCFQESWDFASQNPILRTREGEEESLAIWVSCKHGRHDNILPNHLTRSWNVSSSLSQLMTLLIFHWAMVKIFGSIRRLLQHH